MRVQIKRRGERKISLLIFPNEEGLYFHILAARTKVKTPDKPEFLL